MTFLSVCCSGGKVFPRLNMKVLAEADAPGTLPAPNLCNLEIPGLKIHPKMLLAQTVGPAGSELSLRADPCQGPWGSEMMGQTWSLASQSRIG